MKDRRREDTKMNTAASTILAAPGLDSDSTGVIAYWSMSGGDCDYATLIETLNANGFTDEDAHPPLPTPKVAFYRAVTSFETPHRFVRKSAKAKCTYHLIDEREDGGDLEFTKNVKLTLNAGNMVEGEGEDPGNLTEAVTAEYLKQLRKLTPSDVSGWLVKQVH